MFNILEKVAYGTSGACIIEEIGRAPHDPSDLRVYYKLRPIHARGGDLIFSPVDQTRVPIRPLQSREELLSLLADVKSIEPVAVDNERQRRPIYREILSHCVPADCLRILRTVRERRAQCGKGKRRLSETDAEFEARALYCLASELAEALGIPLGEAEERIAAALVAAD